MKNLIAVGFIAALAACGGGKSTTTKTDSVVLVDAKGSNPTVDAPPAAACSVLTQAGCMAGQKCAWVLSTDPTATAAGLGAIACAPDGTVAAGGACTIQMAAAGGNDNCKGGNACVSGSCKQICDNNGGTPACGTNQACVTYSGLFANEGATTTPAGVCDPSCNPLVDNDFDGSGAAHTKTGTACGASATVGCYGQPSATSTTYFTCAPPAGGTGNLTHRSVIPGTVFYLNDCMSGYTLGFAADATGSMNTDCYAWCAPGDAYMGNAMTQNPNGVVPHRCNNNDALGAFGATATATVNGEHCMYSYNFEEDAMGVVHHSPTSNTVGICWDHTKYKYDPNMTGTPDTILPACATLAATSATALAAVDLGCVNTTIGMKFTSSKEELEAQHAKRLRLGIQMPEMFGGVELRRSMR